MELQLRDALAEGFGPEPPHRPVQERVAAGRRAVRRRRWAAGSALVAVLGVIGGVASLARPGATDDGHVAHTGSPSPGLPNFELARYRSNGTLALHPGVTVLDSVDSPVGSSANHKSTALDVTYGGRELWLLLEWNHVGADTVWTSSNTDRPSAAWAGFRDWAAHQQHDPNSGIPVVFDTDGRLIPAEPKVTIEEQQTGINFGVWFAPPGKPTAAAKLVLPDGYETWALVRDVGGVQTDLVDLDKADSLQELITWAKAKYSHGPHGVK